MRQGVYQLFNLDNGKAYIGSAVNIESRFSEHKHYLNSNRHDNDYLQKSWNKHGANRFELRILEEVLDVANLIVREQYWIDYYKTSDERYGYNIRKIASSNLGLKHTSETKEKIRKGNLGNNWMIGVNNPFFGKTHTYDALVKMRTPRSEEVKQKFSDAAKKRWAGHILIKICLNCQISFDTVASDDNDFCSKQCSSRYYGRIKTQESTLIKNCLICNIEFRTSISEDKKYCNRKCWAISMRGNKNQSK
jgi:group I intron endonuclease